MDILTLEPSFEYHVQIFSRGAWKDKIILSDLEEANEKCEEMALVTLERCRVLRIDYLPIKIYHYARKRS